MITTSLGTCDVCDRQNVELANVTAFGIETAACAKCRGEDEPESTPAHTPGPWRLTHTHYSEPHRGVVGWTMIEAGDGQHYNADTGVTVYCTGPDNIGGAERAANARLIAAAPDMLEALRIDELLYTVGFNRLAAEQIGNEARTAYAMGGTVGLREYGLKVRRAALAKAEGRS